MLNKLGNAQDIQIDFVFILLGIVFVHVQIHFLNESERLTFRQT